MVPRLSGLVRSKVDPATARAEVAVLPPAADAPTRSEGAEAFALIV